MISKNVIFLYINTEINAAVFFDRLFLKRECKKKSLIKMKKPATTQKTAKIWKAHLAAAYTLGAFSALGLLGAAENHSNLEAHDSTIGLALAIVWALVVQFMIWRRRSRDAGS